MIDDDFTTKTGHTLDDLARDARTLFLVMHLRDAGEWMSVDQQVRMRWIERVVEPVVFQVTQEINTSWADLTSRVYGQFYNKPAETFHEETRYTRLAWQAVVRHLVNMMCCEDTDDIRSMGPDVDAYWKEWLSEKLKEKESQNGENSRPPEDDED